MSSPKITFRDLWKKSWADLKGNYWKSIAVILIVGAIESAAAGIGCSVCAILLLPLQVGLSLFFLQVIRKNPSRIESVFHPFRQYGHYLWVAVRRNLFVFLWSLLLLIPGIIAHFRYALTNYVAVDEPELSAKEAMEKSCRLMKGHKLQLFGYGIIILLFLLATGICTFCLLVLGLQKLYPEAIEAIAAVSGLSTFGIAIFWLGPWTGTFVANFYLAVRKEAEPAPESGIDTPADAQVQ